LIQPPGGETLALKIFQLAALRLRGAGECAERGVAWVGGAAAGGLGRLAVAEEAVVRGACCVDPACVLLSCCGCSPTDDSRANRVESRLFERAEVIGSRGVGLGEFNKPRSLAVDLQDNVYAVDMTGRVQKFRRTENSCSPGKCRRRTRASQRALEEVREVVTDLELGPSPPAVHEPSVGVRKGLL